MISFFFFIFNFCLFIHLFQNNSRDFFFFFVQLVVNSAQGILWLAN